MKWETNDLVLINRKKKWTRNHLKTSSRSFRCDEERMLSLNNIVIYFNFIYLQSGVSCILILYSISKLHPYLLFFVFTIQRALK